MARLNERVWGYVGRRQRLKVAFGRFNHAWPSSQRCRDCGSPFRGPFAMPYRAFGVSPAQMNPNFCNLCYLQSPLEGAEQEITAMFVDVRGFTELSQTMSPTRLTDLMNEFYRVAAAAVIAQDGHVDKFVGDQIMAYFGPPHVREAHASRAVQAAIDIINAVAALDAGFEPGAGVATGIARIGPIGGSGVQDYTVLGSVVNLASRIQGQAASGEILLSESTYEQVAEQFPGLAVRSLELKGVEGVTSCRVLDAAVVSDGSKSRSQAAAGEPRRVEFG